MRAVQLHDFIHSTLPQMHDTGLPTHSVQHHDPKVIGKLLFSEANEVPEGFVYIRCCAWPATGQPVRDESSPEQIMV